MCSFKDCLPNPRPKSKVCVGLFSFSYADFKFVFLYNPNCAALPESYYIDMSVLHFWRRLKLNPASPL